jgi:hypothetical protein
MVQEECGLGKSFFVASLNNNKLVNHSFVIRTNALTTRLPLRQPVILPLDDDDSSMAKQDIINATEFCSILNSDDDTDPTIVLKTFKRFLRTVRWQQQQSSSSSSIAKNITTTPAADLDHDDDDHDDDGDNPKLPVVRDDDQQPQQQVNDDEMEVDDQSEDEEENDKEAQQQEQPRRKKIKKNEEEAWKADTAAYNVPFVGTAVASSHGQPDPVQVGEWPTGLLKAYIAKSPLAVELIAKDGAVGGGGGGGRFLPHQKWYKKLAQQKRNDVADKIVNAFWQILTLLVVPGNVRFVQHFLSTATLADVFVCWKQQQGYLNLYAETMVPFLTAVVKERRSVARSIVREIDEGILSKLLHAKSSTATATATVQLVVALRHDGLLALAFPVAVLQQHHHHGMKVIGELITYAVNHLHRSWYFFTRDVLKALCKIPGTEILLTALATNVNQSPLYARKSNEPLLLRLVAHQLLPNVETVRAVLRQRPRCLEQFYDELTVLPDYAVEPMKYVATLRTLTVLAQEFPDFCDLPKNFRRQHILKAINSANPLVAYQTLVYLSAVLDNFRSNASIERKASLLEILPDASTVVNAIAKFPSDGRPNGILRAYACTMISKHLQLLVPGSEYLDLTKLLPKTSFEKLPSSLQQMIVRAVRDSLAAITVRTAILWIVGAHFLTYNIMLFCTKVGSGGVEKAIQSSHGTVVPCSSSKSL